MKPEDLFEGQTVYEAAFADTASGAGEKILVREFTVFKLTKALFEFRGKHSRIRALYRTKRDFIGTLQTSPAEAVKNLQRRLELEHQREEKSYLMRQQMFEERQLLLTNWYYERGL